MCVCLSVCVGGGGVGGGGHFIHSDKNYLALPIWHKGLFARCVSTT